MNGFRYIQRGPCQSGEGQARVDLEALTDYSQMKGKLAMEVVSAERNAELLETVPHKNMEDMAIVWRMLYKNMGRCFVQDRMCDFGSFLSCYAGYYSHVCKHMWGCVAISIAMSFSGFIVSFVIVAVGTVLEGIGDRLGHILAS